MNGSIYKVEDLPLVIQPEVREKCNNWRLLYATNSTCRKID